MMINKKKLDKLCLATQIIINEAKKRGIKVKILLARKNFIKLSKNSKSIYIKNTKMPINSGISMFIAKDKELTNLVLENNKLPTPQHFVCTNINDVKKFIEKIQAPYVIKATDLSGGEDVYTDIANYRELFKIAQREINKHGEIILEKFILGNDYRLVVVDAKFCSAVLRTPAQVVGDGKNNIKTLITIENKNPLRGNDDNSKPLLKIKVDQETKNILKNNNLTLESIPSKNKKIILKETANCSKGGKTKGVTKTVHDDFKKLAEKAAKVLGLKFAGVDIITKDISKNHRESPGYIIEVNSSPDFDMNQYPSSGPGDDMGKVVIDMLEKYYFK